MAKSKRRIPKSPPKHLIQTDKHSGAKFAQDGDYTWTLDPTRGWKRVRTTRPDVPLENVNPLCLFMMKIAYKTKGIV